MTPNVNNLPKIFVTNNGQLFQDIDAEVARARAKFPSNAHLMAALTEEVGELAQALLKGESRERIREEAVQVCCVAIRIIQEGDGDFPGSGPHALEGAQP